MTELLNTLLKISLAICWQRSLLRACSAPGLMRGALRQARFARERFLPPDYAESKTTLYEQVDPRFRECFGKQRSSTIRADHPDCKLNGARYT